MFLIRVLKILNVESQFSAEVGDGESCSFWAIWEPVETCLAVTIWRCYWHPEPQAGDAAEFPTVHWACTCNRNAVLSNFSASLLLPSDSALEGAGLEEWETKGRIKTG